MRLIDDPSSLTPDERFAEVAGILAAGILRLHTRAALPENTAESGSPGLEVPDEAVLSVHSG